MGVAGACNLGQYRRVPAFIDDDALRSLAQTAVDGPIQTAAFFRPRFDLPPGAPLSGNLFSMLNYAIRTVGWKATREASIHHLPRQTYVAVTEGSIYMVEFRFGGVPRLHSTVGSWPRQAVRGSRPNRDRDWLDLAVEDGRLAGLEAIGPGVEAIAVMNALTN
jgi:hypothetical protein